MSTSNAVLQRLRAAGVRPTISRIGVFQILESHAGALTAEEVFRAMLLRGLKTTIGTVYRVIHELEDGGLLLREWDASRKAHYRFKPPDHDRQSHRIVCQTCSRCMAFTDLDLQSRLKSIAEDLGITLSAQALTVHAECAGCKGAEHRRPQVHSPRRLASATLQF